MYYPHIVVVRNSLPKSESPNDTACTGFSGKHMFTHREQLPFSQWTVMQEFNLLQRNHIMFCIKYKPSNMDLHIV
jgi:hypothetical protein